MATGAWLTMLLSCSRSLSSASSPSLRSVMSCAVPARRTTWPLSSTTAAARRGGGAPSRPAARCGGRGRAGTSLDDDRRTAAATARGPPGWTRSQEAVRRPGKAPGSTPRIRNSSRRPDHTVGRHVPFPAPDLGDPLRLLELLSRSWSDAPGAPSPPRLGQLAVRACDRRPENAVQSRAAAARGQRGGEAKAQPAASSRQVAAAGAITRCCSTSWLNSPVLCSGLRASPIHANSGRGRAAVASA